MGAGGHQHDTSTCLCPDGSGSLLIWRCERDEGTDDSPALCSFVWRE